MYELGSYLSSGVISSEYGSQSVQYNLDYQDNQKLIISTNFLQCTQDHILFPHLLYIHVTRRVINSCLFIIIVRSLLCIHSFVKGCTYSVLVHVRSEYTVGHHLSDGHGTKKDVG